MKIERVDGTTVKCFVTNEELEEYDIDYRDFLFRSDKAREMVHDIVQMAIEEVNFQPPQYAFDLQIMMMPEQGLLFTFSEKTPVEVTSLGQLMEYLKNMRALLDVAREKIGLPPVGDGSDTSGQGEGQITTVQGQRRGPEVAIYEFDELSRIMEYATAMPKGLRVDSSVYKMFDKYYLVMSKGTASDDRYIRACVQVLEFGTMYGADNDVYTYLTEHAECIIEQKALRKLRLD